MAYNSGSEKVAEQVINASRANHAIEYKEETEVVPEPKLEIVNPEKANNKIEGAIVPPVVSDDSMGRSTA